MAFEELPAEYDQFFKTGVLPESLAPAPSTPAPAPIAPVASAPEVAPSSTAQPSPTAPAPTGPAPDLSVYEQLIKAGETQRQALEQQLKTLQEQVTKMTATPAPDPTQDPLGYINHQMKTLQDQISSLTKQQTESAQTTQQQAMQQQFVSTVNASINTFKADHADYDDAYKHMINMRTQDYIDSGMTQSEAKAAMANDELAIAVRATQQGKNPAEVVYNMAKRYGFQGNAAPAAAKAENKLETIKKGMEASKTVERASTPTSELSLENIENASDDQLTDMVINHWDKIVGKSRGIF